MYIINIYLNQYGFCKADAKCENFCVAFLEKEKEKGT